MVVVDKEIVEVVMMYWIISLFLLQRPTSLMTRKLNPRAKSKRVSQKMLPKVIKWSAVPLPCSTFLSFHGGKQSSGPDRGLKPEVWLAGSQARLDGPEGGTDGQTGRQTNIWKISPF